MTQSAFKEDHAPPLNCALCPRLVSLRHDLRRTHPDWHNGPVPSFGAPIPHLLIVGLAPGRKGANRTGRPFTGDDAGILLYNTLLTHGFAHGTYEENPNDGLTLDECLITNAVRCLPPDNKPVAAEINRCRPFLTDLIFSLPDLRAILVLGHVAHNSVLSALNLRRSRFPFSHGGQHDVLPTVKLFNSYHCSRYNTNTGRLTEAMFNDVFSSIRQYLNK
ncbi:MAG: uracil-DNA glycosylase [Parvularculales bacterium]